MGTAMNMGARAREYAAPNSGASSSDVRSTRAPSSLYDRLADLREEYRAESVLTMTVSAPPTVWTMNQDRTMTLSEEPAAVIGLSLSGSMVRLLGHPEGYGLRFIVRRALHSFEAYCSRKHRAWPDHKDCPLCAQMAWSTIRDGTSLLYLSETHSVALPRAERMLLRACDFIDSQRERWELSATA